MTKVCFHGKYHHFIAIINFFNKEIITVEQYNKLIQEADKGDQRAQYDVGMLFNIYFMFSWKSTYDINQGTCITMVMEYNNKITSKQWNITSKQQAKEIQMLKLV